MPLLNDQLIDGLLLIARLLLAFVLGIAGVAKLFDRDGSRRSMIDFGVPERFAALFGSLLPVIEILVALALIPIASTWYGALGALTLLAIFTIGIAVKLARGESADCHCFGQLQSGPVGWSTLVRNIVLLALAASVVLAGRDGMKFSAVSWFADLRTTEIVSFSLSVLVIGLLASATVYVRRLTKHLAKVLETVTEMKRVIDEDYAPPVERDDGSLPIDWIPIGTTAPGFSLPSIRGRETSLDDLLDYGQSVLLLFVSPKCGPCRIVLNKISDWQRDYGDQVTIALLSKGTGRENEERVGGSGARHVLLQADDEGVFEDYQAKWTPAAMIISRKGRTASRMTYGEEAIQELVENTFAKVGEGLMDGGVHGEIPITKIGHSELIVGDPAPRFSLPDLEGRLVRSEDLLNRDTLLLFWNPACPFCQKMSDDIRNWEGSPPLGAPRLVFVSSKSAEVAGPGGAFASLVLVDVESEVSPMFGSNSTPSAVLIDSDGTIASEVAGGAPNVLALAGVPFVKRRVPVDA